MKKVKLYEDFLSEAAFLDYSIKPETGRLKVGDKVIVKGPEGEIEDVIVSIEGGQYRLAKSGLQGTIPMVGESLANEAVKIKMNALDWGKSTAERNANLDKYDSLKTDKEREAFLRKLKGESVNEAKKLDRDEMMEWLDNYLSFTRTSEEFDGAEGGIWTTGENGEEYKGRVIYDYYSEDYKNREFGVLTKWEKELNKRGWYSEWYDAGTVMIWPM